MVKLNVSNETAHKTTHNLAFAAFLILRGHKLVCPPFKCENNLGVEGYAFSLDVPFEELDSLYRDFESSDAKKYDSIAQDLRKLVRNIHGTDKAKAGD